jgi:NRAMP (natural resistance-associated macrophage protein)-like metal ion transporter
VNTSGTAGKEALAGGSGEETRLENRKSFLSSVGPGLVTGAADDDPAGIATYSIAGAQHGLTLLYTALFTWPLMAAVQMMCARIGMVSGQGLVYSLRKKFPRWVIWIFVLSLFVANTFNIGADLAGMSDAAIMLTGIRSKAFVVGFGVLIGGAMIYLRYVEIAQVLKWLALVLFAYVACAFLVVKDWSQVLSATFIPSWPKTNEVWKTLVAILGTTISPYLFCWQASQEVEEEKCRGLSSRVKRQNATRQEICFRKWDVGTGTFFSNLVMYFIILTTAVTLHAHGITGIQTSTQAAEALRPLAGKFATLLYTVGIVGVGLLAIPTLAGSAAYGFAEAFRWRQGLDEKPKTVKQFYAVIVISTLLGIAFDFVGLNPIRALFWSGIINGLLAPFIIVGILAVASDNKLMKGQPSPVWARWVVGFTGLSMFAAAAAMFLL